MQGIQQEAGGVRVSYDEHEEMVAGRFCHHCGAAQSDVEVRPIPGYPGYFASSEGRILGPRGWMQGSTNRGGYLNVCLPLLGRRGPGRHTVRVHRLVLLAFRGPGCPGQLVRHLNGDRRDNRPENLAYGTNAENARDKVLHGNSMRGEKSTSAKLTELDVKDIRSSESTDTELAARYGVHRSTIQAARIGRTWGHLK